MGTRSLTVVLDEHGKEIICMYRQYDGYPSGGLGDELAEFLKPFTVVNGLSGREQKVANGMGCLAAQLIATLKTEPGNVYLKVPGSRDMGEEYIYTIYHKDKALHLRCQAGRMTFFGLPGTKQDNMPILFDGPVSQWNGKSATDAEEKLRDSIPNDFLESQKKKV